MLPLIELTFFFSDISAVDSNCVEDQNEPLWNVNYDSAPDWMKNCFHQVSHFKNCLMVTMIIFHCHGSLEILFIGQIILSTVL